MTISEQLTRDALAFKYEQLPAAVVHEAKRRLLDTVACAVAGSDSPPALVLLDLIQRLGGTSESTVVATGLRTSCMNAALVNGAMVRFTEAMDTAVDTSEAGGGSVIYGHFDEVIPTVLAVAERQHSSGHEVLACIVLGYELFNRLARAAGGAHVLEEHGVKSEIFGSLIVPILAGRLMGLTPAQTVNAMGVAGSYAGALALLDAAAEEQTMARNLRFPMNAYQAIFATLMAERGFEGPARVLEGHNGFIDVLLRGQFDLGRLSPRDGDFAILHTWTKAFPVSILLQSQTEALLGLIEEHDELSADRIARIRILQNSEIVAKGNHPTYRYPRTKETADKSACYAAALVIVDREIRLNLDQFTPERLQEPRLRAVIDKTELIDLPDWSRQQGFPAEVEITAVDGKVHRRRVEFPRGHERNPMTDEDLEAKFRSAATRLMDEAQMKRLIGAIARLDALMDIGELTRTLALAAP